MDTYSANLNIIRKRWPELASQLESTREDERVSLQASQSGQPTLILHQEPQALALHHPSDPIGHAREFIDSIEAVAKSRNIALLGLGLGYPALHILRTNAKLQNFFVLEPSISVLRQAIKTVDLTPLFASEKVQLIVGESPGDVYQTLLGSLMEMMANPLTVIQVPAITSAFPEWTQKVTQEIKEVVQFGQSGLITKFKDGPLTISNLLQNLPVIAQSPGLNQLGTSLNKIPAIIVAAGPSLQKNVDLLKNCSEHFLILCCDTAFEFLLSKGIIPHFVVTVDPTPLNLKHFPREQYDEKTILLFDPEAHPEVTTKFPRRMTFMTDKHPFFTWLDQSLNQPGIIPKGGMVSQAGIFAAHALGCNPIILIGQDLALDKKTGATHNDDAALCRHVTYIKGEPHHADVPTFSNEKPISREPLFWVEGTDGEQVPTVQSFLVYLRMIENDIRKHSLNLIDATEGGAKITGTTILSLNEALRYHNQSTVFVSDLLNAIGWTPASNSDDLTNSTLQQISELLTICKKTAQQGLQELSQSTQSVQRMEQIARRLQQQLFGNPITEYLIEYAAPRELFEFLKLPPADATEHEEHQRLSQRIQALLTATETATKLLDPSLNQYNKKK